jgi:hypothetical protein
LVERVIIGPDDNGLEVEIVGEIARMVELGIGGGKNKPAILTADRGVPAAALSAIHKSTE